MRFVLDQDVDHAVAGRLRSLGHDVWTAAEAGLSTAADDDLAVYVQDKRAVLLTHDREFSQRRRKFIIGRHIWMRCPEPDAADLLSQLLPELLPVLERYDDLFIAISKNGYQVTFK